MIWGRRQHSHVAAPVVETRAKRVKLAPPRRTSKRSGIRPLPEGKMVTIRLDRVLH